MLITSLITGGILLKGLLIGGGTLAGGYAIKKIHEHGYDKGEKSGRVAQSKVDSKKFSKQEELFNKEREFFKLEKNELEFILKQYEEYIESIQKGGKKTPEQEADLTLLSAEYQAHKTNTVAIKLSEYEIRYLGINYLLYFFAKCDGTVAKKEQIIIDDFINKNFEQKNISSEVVEAIENIKKYNVLPFFKVKIHLYAFSVDELTNLFNEIIKIVSVDLDLTAEERKAIQNFSEYIDERKQTIEHETSETLATNFQLDVKNVLPIMAGIMTGIKLIKK